jgi:site-specific recombinase XerD
MSAATFKAIQNNKKKDDGTYHILIRITKDRKRSYLSTGIYVKKTEFNGRKGEVRSGVNAGMYNNAIARLIKEAEEVALNNRDFSAAQIKERLVNGETSSPNSEPSFLAYYNQFLAQLEKRIGKQKGQGISPRAYDKYKSDLDKLKKYVGEDKDLLFKGFTAKFIKSYEQHLLTFNAQNTASKALSRLKTITMSAIEEGIIEYHANPFLHIKLKFQRGTKQRLEEEEIKLIEELDLKKDSPEYHARNIYLFQYYAAGTRIADVLQLTWGKVSTTGRLYFQMDKTEAEVSIKLPDQAMKLLNLYGPGKPKQFIFPYLSNDIDYSDVRFLEKQLESKTTMINRYLKKVAERAGIEKNITTHTARHSFANNARKKTNDIYAVSKALRHSKISTTEIYLSSFDESTVDGVLGDIFGGTKEEGK